MKLRIKGISDRQRGRTGRWVDGISRTRFQRERYRFNPLHNLITENWQGDGGSLVSNLKVETTGGWVVNWECPARNSCRIQVKITDRTAVINLPVATDSVDEGIEEATFALEAGEGYQVDPLTSSATFTIADTPDQLPLIETEANDTIPTAFVTGLSAAQPTFSISAEIAAHGEGLEAVDTSEDIDLYAVDLQAGDTISVDVDAIEYEITGLIVPQRLDSVLRLFNADGDELLTADNVAAPDEADTANGDAYLTFTAETAGSYYVGVGQLGTTTYDPFTSGSGSGIVNPAAGINTGAYSLDINLTPGS